MRLVPSREGCSVYGVGWVRKSFLPSTVERWNEREKILYLIISVSVAPLRILFICIRFLNRIRQIENGIGI
jgi:hypothetical protein